MASTDDDDRGYARPDTGRPAYHEADEAWTDRRVKEDFGRRDCGQARIKITRAFWKDRLEEATYQAAVVSNPQRQAEGPMAYVQRISALVTGERQKVHSMPHVRQSRSERDEALSTLRSQQ